ncbi:uncharacterized protein LOC125535139 [Triticum urartu]|uniref:uncharacterized protein LOC125535139 n=1 Tax=Triticum urartu TaxID=4572 RepID=UPI0020436AD8|nr:uncharacterized protein LOC125535139 [Triticum urartu]XP_048554147.1 uncharacterized protein LOC125535139 [Triticum urartu]
MQRPGEEICRLNLWDKGQVFAATENLQRSIEQTPYSIQADTIVCCFSLSRCQSESSSYAGYASSDGGDNPASSSAQQLHYPSHAHMDPGHVQLILPGSMTLLEDIFHNYEVTFGPGYKEILLQAFSANSDKLCSFFYEADVPWILRRSTRTFKDPSECTEELITMLKVNTQVLCLMQHQLCEQSRPFEELKIGYFNQFAKCHIKKLLDIAVCLSETVWSATHICPMLLAYEALMDVLPLIQKFASSESDDFFSNILRNMREAFRKLIGHIKHFIQSNMEKHLDDVAIHPMTCFLICSIKSFGSHRNLVQSTLAPGDNSSSFGHLLYDVITCWKSVLTEHSNIYRADLQRQYIFLLNNAYHFNTKTDGLLDELLSDRQIIKQHDDEFKLLFKKWTESCTEEACTPAKSCLNPNCWWGSQRRSLVAFTSKFNKTFDRQKTWKVPDVVLRQVLKDRIQDCILPDYTRCLENCSSSGLFCSCLQIASGDIYTTETLETTVQGFFEG